MTMLRVVTCICASYLLFWLAKHMPNGGSLVEALESRGALIICTILTCVVIAKQVSGITSSKEEGPSDHTYPTDEPEVDTDSYPHDESEPPEDTSLQRQSAPLAKTKKSARRRKRKAYKRLLKREATYPDLVDRVLTASDQKVPTPKRCKH